jgi:putative cardiolipin synthase
VQYYIWHADTSGQLLAHELLQAADRGVRVRLLLDDLDTAGKDTFLSQFDAHPNISVRLYNPFAYRGNRGLGFASDLSRLNHRMHNKSLTADNLLTVVGGRNIGNEYFNGLAYTAFSDLDVLAVGPVVNAVSSMFDQYWNSDAAVPMAAFARADDVAVERLSAARSQFEAVARSALASDYVQAIKESGWLEQMQLDQLTFAWGSAHVIFDDPDKPLKREVTAETHLAPQLLPMLQNAAREVLIVSPYFVPGDTLVEFLAGLEHRGIQVRILTNSLAANDVGLVHAGYMRYRKDLLRAGVELYEFKPEPGELQRNKRWTGSSAASLHAKTLGVDARHVFVGSFNLDPRSVALNTEMGIIIDNNELAAQMRAGFEQVVSHSAYAVALNGEGDLRWLDPAAPGSEPLAQEPRTTWWQRFVVGTLSLVVPESML